jgi:Uma2 family endonuclease
MTTVTTELMTADEFFAWCNRPENRDRHFELERGKVVEVSRPGERHGVVCGDVVWILGGYVRQCGTGYVVGNDTGVIWEQDPDTVRGPDVFYYGKSRPFGELHPKYTEKTPQLVVEVLSPNDRMNKVMRRITKFLDWDVPLVWLIDPEDLTVSVYRQDRRPEVLEGEQELTGDDVLPGFRCRIADFFFMPGEAAPADPPPVPAP